MCAYHLQRAKRDKRGAIRIAVFVFVSQMVVFLLVGDHVASLSEMSVLNRELASST